jgi:RNA polymerase sigma-70 factor (ECF subfamily)
MPLSFSRDCERRLIAAIRTGNPTTYTKIVEYLYRPLVTYATTLTKSSFDAEEIVQDILVRLWQARKRLVVSGSFRSYLLQAIRNGVFDHYRRQQRQKESNNQHAVSSHVDIFPYPSSVMSEMISEEMEAIVVTTLRSMPERWRSVFLLCVVERYTQQRASHLLGLSRGRTTLYLQHARHAIAKQLRDLGFNVPVDLQTKERDAQWIPQHAYLPLRNPRVHITMATVSDCYDASRPFSSIRVIQRKANHMQRRSREPSRYKQPQ